MMGMMGNVRVSQGDKMFILVGDDGYILASSTAPLQDGIAEAVDVPEAFDDLHQNAYRYDAEAYTVALDPDRLECLVRDEEEAVRARERAGTALRQREEAAIRLQEINAEQAARNAEADDVLDITPLLPEWKSKKYNAGSIVRFEGCPYKAREAIDDPLWNPRTAPGAWIAYHAKTRERALPYRHGDSYGVGEWMIWTDGQARMSMRAATVGTPDTDPLGWKKG